jgi:hypothetical protein
VSIRGAWSPRFRPSTTEGWYFPESGGILESEFFDDGGPVAVNVTDTASLTLSEAIDLLNSLGLTDTASLSLSETALAEPVEPAPDDSFSGGFFYAFEAQRERARRERQKRLDDEAEAERIADETAREIAAYLHRQEALDAERRELDRLKSLVDLAARERASEAFSERVQAAYDRATVNMTTSALLAFQRELERQMEEEEYAVLLLLLDD